MVASRALAVRRRALPPLLPSSLLLLILILLSLASQRVQIRSIGNNIGGVAVGVAKTKKLEEQRVDVDDSSTPTRHRHFVPCTISDLDLPLGVGDEDGIGNAQTVATGATIGAADIRFRAAPASEWSCRYEAGRGRDDDDVVVGVVRLELEVRECPPAYAASTFRLQTLSTWKEGDEAEGGGAETSFRITGTVGDRLAVRDGCGLYNATVAAVVATSDGGIRAPARPGGGGGNGSIGGTMISVELFWTSSHRHYSNTVEDILRADEIKANDTMRANASLYISAGRRAYLEDRHMDGVAGFPRTVGVDAPVGSGSDNDNGNDNDNENENGEGSIVVNNNVTLLDEGGRLGLLPDCATMPISEWEPVGVVMTALPPAAAAAPQSGQEEKKWRFQSARCNFVERPLSLLNREFAGLRVRYLGDSHGQFLGKYWQQLMCPEAEVTENEYFAKHKYDCPHRNNTFQWNLRFFRGIFDPKRGVDSQIDFDNLSGDLRRGNSKESCRNFLGIGLYNATIVMVPHWLFPYETSEGLDHFLVSLRSVVDNCRSIHPDLMERHVVLLQSPTAIDPLPKPRGYEALDWRGIDNAGLEDFVGRARGALLADSSYLDGIVPMFELTHARSWTVPTTDGTHLPMGGYGDMIPVQTAAVLSAMRHHGHGGLGALPEHDPGARWFADVELGK